MTLRRVGDVGVVGRGVPRPGGRRTRTYAGVEVLARMLDWPPRAGCTRRWWRRRRRREVRRVAAASMTRGPEVDGRGAQEKLANERPRRRW